MITSCGRRIGALVALILLAALTALTAPLPAAAETRTGTGEWWYTQLDVPAANRVSTGAGATVAVLDSGVQASLPAFGGRVLAGKSFVGGGDGRTDNPSRTEPTFGHGTAVAGFIAAAGRNGVAGVAPGAKILPVTVGRSESAEGDAVDAGIVWAADHGADVINVSSAGAGTCTAATQGAVDHALRKGVIVVAGTGNTTGVPVGIPANCIGVIGVGGLDYSGFRAWTRGTTGRLLDFVAPAENLSGLLLDGTASAPTGEGTSFATAMVSGTFALLRAKFPTESARQLVTRALWNVKNELGGKIFARRIDDQLGYGEVLPRFALTEAPPAGAANPIYDEVDAHLAATAPASSPATSASPSTRAEASDPAGAGQQDTAGVSPAVVAVLAVVVVVAAVVVVASVRRSRRRPPGGGPRAPGGYGYG